MTNDPISGREPALGGGTPLSGEEPFLGGDGSLAGLLNSLGDLDSAPSDVLVARLAGVIPQLAPYLDGDDPRLRQTAARLVGLVAASHAPTRPQTIPLLIQILDSALQGRDVPLVEMAIQRLGDTQDSQAVGRLLRFTTDSEITHYGRIIRASLARLGAVALPELLALAPRGSHFEWSCVVPAIRDICKADPDVRTTVAEWLVPIALDTNSRTYDVVAPLTRVVAPALAFMIQPWIDEIMDESRGLLHRVAVLQRLSDIPDRRVTALMFELLASEQRHFHRFARRALVKSRFREDIPRILHMIAQPDTRIKREGLRITGLRHIRAGLSLVEGALADPKQVVRREAIVAVVRLRDTDSMQRLLPLLNDRAAPVRVRASAALVALARHFPEQRPGIEAAIRAAAENDADPEVRRQVEAILHALIYHISR